METVRCVCLGDSSVGKTSLLMRYEGGKFPGGYIPRISDSANEVTTNGRTVCLQLWDTPGGEEYDRWRPLGYGGARVFLVCFSLVSPQSYERVRSRWHPELVNLCSLASIILVGTKLDLRDDSEIVEELKSRNLSPISYKEGLRMGKEIRAVKYLECSSLTGVGLSEVFDEVLRVAVMPDGLKLSKSRSICSLL